MKKEVVVIFDESAGYQIDVNTRDHTVEIFSRDSSIENLKIVTFQSDLLVNLLGEDVCDVEIIDFECLDKQIRQSIGLEEPQGRWNIPNMISTYLGIEEKDWLHEEREEILMHLTDCYLKMKEMCVGEWQRITDIEIPVNRILYATQQRGIYFNHDRIESLCKELHKNIYGYKNQIQLELGYADDVLEPYLRLKDIKHNVLNDYEVKRLCKVYTELELFRKLRSAQRNFNSLIMLDALRKDTDKCKPLFKGFGTTTGRIILRDPAIQNLSRKLRDLLKQETLPLDYRYVYVDFGQFEAGILAGLSGNKDLQKIYEDDLLYEKLMAMSTDIKDRESAKIAFYCFVYGGIVSKGTELFFDTYGLRNIIENVEQKAMTNGYIESPLGNKRVVRSESDKKWIMNHYIQGTSSLIFKQALIDVYNTYKCSTFLILPMHDAALYIVHSDVSTDSIINIFKTAFRKWIPNSNPVVREKDFFGGE